MRNLRILTLINTRRSARSAGILMQDLEGRTLLTTMHPTFRLANPLGSGTGVRPAYASDATFGSSQLRKAYGIDTASFDGVSLDGAGQTIAIVDAYNAPTIVSDLAAFNALYGLPSGNLLVRNQTGGTTRPANDPSGAGNSWAVETALDVEWAHAFAPNATILLVLANSSSDADLNVATDYARNYAGVSAISMSYGSDEISSSYADDFHYLTPAGHTGITFFSSSGDDGAYSPGTTTKIVGYPASSPNVVGVGGTYLTTNAGGNYLAETGWGSGTSSGAKNGSGGSGGGVSKYAAKPSFQSGITTITSTKRMVPDVSFDADPNSGAAVIDAYDNSGSTSPFTVGGTSLASPLWGGFMALINQARSLVGLGTMNGQTETLPKLYSLPSSDFHDVTSGNNGYAAGVGYDLVTGLGTPVVQGMINDMVGIGPIIGSFAASPATTVVGAASTTLTAANVTDLSSTISSVGFYSESNGTAGLQTDGGTPDTFIGNGVATGASYALSISTDTLAVGTYTYYALATDAAAATATATTTLKVSSGLTSGAILGFDVAGQTGFGTQGLAADTVATGLTSSVGLTRGAGVTVPATGAASNAWGGTNWKTTSALGLSTDATVSFGATVQTGFKLSLSGIALNYRRSGTGAASGLWQYQLNSGAWTTIIDLASAFTVSSSGGGTMPAVDLSSIAALQNLTAGTTVNLRVLPYASTSTSGTWYVYNAATAGDDLVVNGVVSAVATPTPPTVVNAPTATLNAAGTLASLAVLGSDTAGTGEAGISYQWSIIAQPAGSTATLGDNASNAARNSTLSVDLAGAYTLRVTLTGPTGLTRTADVTLNVPLTASAGAFVDATAPLRATFALNGNAAASLDVDDFVLTETTTNTVVTLPAGASVDFDTTTNIATLNFGSTLPSGRYRLTLTASGVSSGTIPLAADASLAFSFLDGDVNDDGAVNFADLLTLAKNYGTSVAIRTGGDLNFDGTVDFADLLILAKNYGTNLPALSASSSAAQSFSSTPIARRSPASSVAASVL